MAITTIDNLTEIQSAGANDVLPISTANGVKKIKASALGGGGGAEDFVVTFTIDDTGGSETVTSDKTVAEIITAYNAGKNIKGNYELDDFTFLPALTGIMDTAEAKFVFFYGYQSKGESREINGMSAEGQEMWGTSVR